MKAYLRNGTIALALFAGIGSARAENPGDSLGIDGLTNFQRHEIWQGVSKHAAKVTPPPGFKAAIGDAVPDSVKVQPMPNDVSSQVQPLKSYDFAVVQNQVLIVDPASKKIVDIITE